jgi:hypothetical protein
MFTIPLVSTNIKLYARLKAIVSSGAQDRYDLLLLTNTKAAEEFLITEMPELVFINFSDNKINAFQLLEALLKDPWLLHGGIIALCKEYHTVEQINAIRGANLLVSLTFADLEKQLPRILEIIHHNRPLLFRRGNGQNDGGVLAGSFRLHNNLFEANCYINLVCNYLYNSNKLAVDKKYFFHLALYEMLINAIEHGNCGITYDEKTRFLEQGGCTPDLIQEKCRDAAVAAKTISFAYAMHPTFARFVITDEGGGFDWRTTIDTMHKKDQLRLHGRGILITRETVRSLQYNDKGNEVTLDIDYETGGSAITPAIFDSCKPLEVKPGDEVVGASGAEDYLFFIVKGRCDVYVDGRKISSLSADDLFLGSMPFPGNDLLSATVRAATDGKIIKISKKDFVKAIKAKPHYALLLARLLSEKIQRLNQAATEQR